MEIEADDDDKENVDKLITSRKGGIISLLVVVLEPRTVERGIAMEKVGEDDEAGGTSVLSADRCARRRTDVD